jgi:hypothetical protein
MHNRKFSFCLFSVFVLIFIAGCAGTRRVDTIIPILNIGKNSNVPSNTKVAFEPFKLTSKDQEENIIGEAKLGFFNSSATIVTTEKINSIVASALKKGFLDAGFYPADPGEADYTVTGVVEKFRVDEYATGLSLEYSKASVKYDIIVKNKKGNAVWANTMEAFKTSPTSMDTTHNNIPTLSLALKESVEAIFRDQTFWNTFRK